MKHKGFSLIELIIAMGLVASLAGVGVASFTRSNRRQSVVAGALRVRQMFSSARANALAGRKLDCQSGVTTCNGPDGSCGTADDLPIVGWGVTLNTVSKTIVMNGYCNPAVAGGTNYTNSLAETLPGANVNVSLSTGQTSQRFMFAPLSGTVTAIPGTGFSGVVTVTIRDLGIAQTQTVQLLSSGEIQ